MFGADARAGGGLLYQLVQKSAIARLLPLHLHRHDSCRYRKPSRGLRNLHFAGSIAVFDSKQYNKVLYVGIIVIPIVGIICMQYCTLPMLLTSYIIVFKNNVLVVSV